MWFCDPAIDGGTGGNIPEGPAQAPLALRDALCLKITKVPPEATL